MDSTIEDEVVLTCAKCGKEFWYPRLQWESDMQFDDYEPYCGCADAEPPGP